MLPSTFSPDWLKKLSDPYAVLGVSVTADDRRVLKRYHAIAKVLHPDRYLLAEPANREPANQLFTRLINPAYEKIKQEKGRAEVMATLRFHVRRLVHQSPLVLQSDIARELLGKPLHEAEVFYEKAIADLADTQFHPLEHFDHCSHHIGELNLVYLHLKMGDSFVREKRTGLVAASKVKPVSQHVLNLADQDPQTDYARRHYDRAQQYMKREAWGQAILELRDALKIAPNQAEYHSLLGLAYLRQDMPGMATVHFRQALKLNATEPLAMQFASKLNLRMNPSASAPSTAIGAQEKNEVKGKIAIERKSVFGLFRRN
jgi:tetratricopeptide (TPR) repeat protein